MKAHANGSGSLLKRIRSRYQQHKLKNNYAIVSQIRTRQLQQMSDEQLRSIAEGLRVKAQEGISLDLLLVDAYALVIETVSRVLGMQLYDVQIAAAIALHHGQLVEMQTGEGKTLAAVLPVYLNAIEGSGVHVLTFNDYLAKRDAEWMRPVYEQLGLTVGYVQEGMRREDRQAAYASDITYLTAKEAGFDYLRDSNCFDLDELVQRKHPFHYVVVDEADSILIDEARVPLILAGEVAGKTDHAQHMAEMAAQMQLGIHYETDEYKRNIYMTDNGIDQAEQLLGCSNLYDEAHLELLTALNHALHAKTLLQRDIDYIVREGKIELIDEFTGRIAANRQLPDGLQAAVEAKEGLAHRSQGKVLGTITLQHLLSLYPKISGMTATAYSSAVEFKETYALEVVPLLPHRPCRREDHLPLVYTHQSAKYNALLQDIAAAHRTGRPILIGTASVEESSHLATAIRELGIRCHVLNAKEDEMEAQIIAQAGTRGAVTVSTNMAGRGVDIRLGAGDEQAAQAIMKLGGLYVIGTNLHESIRIDNQLRGRAGRQGDPGSSQFYVSLEDPLLVRYGIQEALPEQIVSLKQEQPIQLPSVIQAVMHIQRVAEGQNVDIRRNLNKYSDMLEQQRKLLYAWRQQVLVGDSQMQLLENRAASLYQRASQRWSSEVLQKVERQITMYEIDRCWAEHLQYAASIRESIHLVSIHNRSPEDAFHVLIMDAYSQIMDKIEQAIVKTFQKVRITEQGVEMKHSLKRPSATWTYTVHDQLMTRQLSF